MSIPDFPHEQRPLGDLPAGRPLQTDFGDDGRDYPRLGSVSFRRGTLTDNQEKLWEDNWPRLGRVLADERIDLEEWFGRSGAPTILEIGSGTGTSTAAMAPLEADTNIIAVEWYKPGLAKLLGAVVRGGIDNIRMVRGDGVEVLARMLPEASLDGVRIFFPDPWPKARHHKRRIIQTGTLPLIRPRRLRRVDQRARRRRAAPGVPGLAVAGVPAAGGPSGHHQVRGQGPGQGPHDHRVPVAAHRR